MFAKRLHHLVQMVVLLHARDLRVEAVVLHDLEDVVRAVPDVAVQVLRDLVWVVQQLAEVEWRRVVERAPRCLLEQPSVHVRTVARVPLVGGEHRLLRPGEDAVKAAKHGDGEDDLAVLVALVRAAQQVADAPDEVRQLAVLLRVHGLSRSVAAVAITIMMVTVGSGSKRLPMALVA